MAIVQGADSRCAVAIMAKAPRPGQVKTRLCPPLSPQEAAELYRCFLRDKMVQVSGLQGSVAALSYDPPEAKALFEEFTPAHFTLVPQHGEGLGARLIFTFDELFRQGYAAVIAVDSDTPTLPTAYLDHALDMMAKSETDVVLGPTEDGGYYLIGLRRCHRVLFEHMPWSTPQVLAETIRRCQEQGLKVVCVESWFDVDTPADLQRLIASLGTAPGGQAQHTRRFLQEHRW